MNGPVFDKNHQTRVQHDIPRNSSVLFALGQLKSIVHRFIANDACVTPHSNYCALHQSIGTETRNIELDTLEHMNVVQFRSSYKV